MRLKGLIIIAVVIAAVYGVYVRTQNHSQTANNNSNSAPGVSTKDSSSSFDKHKYSTNDPASLWVVVNKARVLPSDYEPANLVVPGVPLRGPATDQEMHLRAEAAKALEDLINDAAKSGIKLRLSSGYRSYSNQQVLYGGYVSQLGREPADASSARPGHSEHQTGLAADLAPTSGVCDIQTCFDTTPEGKWLAANAHRFGFVVRYRQGTQSIVGYQYEPWHIRYFGVDLASRLHDTDQTAEAFFGLPPAPVYPVASYELKTQH